MDKKILLLRFLALKADEKDYHVMGTTHRAVCDLFSKLLSMVVQSGYSEIMEDIKNCVQVWRRNVSHDEVEDNLLQDRSISK